MRLRKLALALSSLVPLTGCGSTSIVATVEPACEAIRHVCISRDDKISEGTAVQIEGNNLARSAMCKPEKDPCAELRVRRPAGKAEPKTS